MVDSGDNVYVDFTNLLYEKYDDRITSIINTRNIEFTNHQSVATIMHAPTILTNVITLSFTMAVAVKQKNDVDVTRMTYNGDDYSFLNVTPGFLTPTRTLRLPCLILPVFTRACQLGYSTDIQRLLEHCPR